MFMAKPAGRLAVWPSGGRIRPHRTHQNGLSVDFFVPVRNAQGKSVPLPISITNRLSYNIEFDISGKYVKPWVRHDEHYHVDFAVPCKPNEN
jgi:murein endopeptidase